MAIPARNSGIGPHRRRTYTPDPTTAGTDYSGLSKEQLVALAKEKELPTSGTKADLIERLTAHEAETDDQEQAQADLRVAENTQTTEEVPSEETTTTEPLAEGRDTSEEN